MLPSCSTIHKLTKVMEKSWKFMKKVMEFDFENCVGTLSVPKVGLTYISTFFIS